MLKYIFLFCAAAFFPSFAQAGESPSLRSQILDAGVEKIVFASREVNMGDGHWYANFGYYSYDEGKKAYRAKGRLSVLNLRTGKLETLLDAPQGAVRDPQVHYDGQKIIFCYRKAGSEYFHLYEINTDGTNLTQLTDGPFDDLEPTYVADGGIVFCSSRCKRWVPCWMVQVAMMYRCEADGSNIRQISSNIEQENTPWPLPDGRILYQRWEYVDRSRVSFHHLWTMNPDGTSQMVYYGNMHPQTVMIDAKPIPDSKNKVVAVFSPKHGRREHEGAITIITPKAGPDELGSARRLNPAENFRDPYPLSEDCFLVARGGAILAMNGQGKTEELYRLPSDLEKANVMVHEPRPLRARPREHVIPPRVDPTRDTGVLFLADVYAGRNMKGVERGEIKKLLVIEVLPKMINFSGQMVPLTHGGSFQLERILGTVDVESDGSAHFEAPANRSLFLVAMDECNLSVKRMQSFLTLMPGETTSCVGCHEQRTRAPLNANRPSPLAATRAPQKIQSIPGIPDVFDFPRDIQPILDRHCLKCHDYDKREGGVILSGDHGPVYSHSYYSLTYFKQFADGRDRPIGNLPPRSIGSCNSPLLWKLGLPGEERHHDVQATPHEINMVRYWIESAAPYTGTYAGLGTGMIGGWSNSKAETADRKWPETKAVAKTIERRCSRCHDSSFRLPLNLSDDFGIKPSLASMKDPMGRLSRHRLFNLTRPELSLMLLAPLAKEAGGYGICGAKKDQKVKKSQPARVPIFLSAADPDYQKILALCCAGRDYLAHIKRFDMEGFLPRPEYIRELKKYGILSSDAAPDAPFDTYAADQAYWTSLWYRAKE